MCLTLAKLQVATVPLETSPPQASHSRQTPRPPHLSAMEEPHLSQQVQCRQRARGRLNNLFQGPSSVSHQLLPCRYTHQLPPPPPPPHHPPPLTKHSSLLPLRTPHHHHHLPNSSNRRRRHHHHLLRRLSPRTQGTTTITMARTVTTHRTEPITTTTITTMGVLPM